MFSKKSETKLPYEYLFLLPIVFHDTEKLGVLQLLWNMPGLFVRIQDSENCSSLFFGSLLSKQKHENKVS